MSICFTAATPDGRLRLQCPARARHAADAALALLRCDPLLVALQDWTGLPLDWRWEPAAAPLPAAGPHAWALWRLRDDGLLALPWSLLRGLPAPPASLAALLQWPALPAVLSISQLRLDGDELSQLEPGGALILPESLLSPWHGLLRAAGEPAEAGIPVALPSPTAPRLAAGDARSIAPPGAGDYEVRLALPDPVPADRLTGWFDGEALAAGPDAGLWRHAGAVPLAAGRLMPWGDGWALAIETVSTID
ncbi:MAG TPA: hypothetical protein VFV25_05365 [Methylibium sp.]